jgi:hypothetical protein
VQDLGLCELQFTVASLPITLLHDGLNTGEIDNLKYWHSVEVGVLGYEPQSVTRSEDTGREWAVIQKGRP